jgi:hypothetical protein
MNLLVELLAERQVTRRSNAALRVTSWDSTNLFLWVFVQVHTVLHYRVLAVAGEFTCR